jgi:hypothetical protein
MKIPTWIETANAESSFVIANTPSFLLRRLREDKASYQLSQSMSDRDLLATFTAAISEKPETMRDQITPYLILVALSLKTDVKFLRDAKTLAAGATTSYKWLDACAQILIEEFRPTSLVKMGPRTYQSGFSIQSNANVNFQSHKVSGS